jgi:hypothetical protein
MRVCIGIICIGQRYLSDFEATFKPSVVKYAQKHGYDLKIFTDFLDSDHKHPDSISFQKCLVPQALSEYDIVVVMDADIWISESAPAIPVCEKIGIVNEAGQFPPEVYSLLNFVSQPTEYYSLGGFDLSTDKILNTGFIVCRPTHHAKFLADVYAKYIDKSVNHPRKFHYEQACIGYELQSQSQFELISNQWNSIYIFYTALNIPIKGVYGLHFAGMGGSTRSSELNRYLTVQRQQRGIRWGIRK